MSLLHQQPRGGGRMLRGLIFRRKRNFIENIERSSNHSIRIPTMFRIIGVECICMNKIKVDLRGRFGGLIQCRRQQRGEGV